MSSRKAKQTVKNTSAQVARAHAFIRVEPPVTAGLAAGPGSTSSKATEEPARTPETANSEDQEDASSESASQLLSGLPPIYLALAISINVAADFQKKNRNIVERD